MRGKNVGVFVGRSVPETFGVLADDVDRADGRVITGCSDSMMSNQISFLFDFKGPSLTLDTACSSSAYALNQAVLFMRSNQCEAAIVAGINITLNPTSSLGFLRLGMLANDGKCKVFDSSARGYVRAETISAVLVQKASDARRIYATIIHTKVNVDGAKEEGNLPHVSIKIIKPCHRPVAGKRLPPRTVNGT